MHGLVNATLQCFVADTYGAKTWGAVLRRADLSGAEFEAMLVYDDAVTARLVAGIAAELARPADTVLEDVGHYLVSHARRAGLRRLLRFSGRDFRDFLHALDELPDRVRLAVPDLDLPRIELRALSPEGALIACRNDLPGASHVLLGLLRAMADDYGALAYLDLARGEGGTDVISVRVASEAFSEGRAFSLAAEGARR
ncbi:heme NO-binding domain-containing protein [Roseivivax sp.]